MKPAINIRLEKEMLKSLDNYARELEKSRTSLIEKAIDLYFDKLDEMVADKRIDALKKGETEVIPMNLLLDTHVFLWSLFTLDKLSETVISEIKSPNNDVGVKDRDFKTYHKFGLRTFW